MTMNERRAEIMRILVARRATTMPVLARTFGVTTRTIQNDILALTVDYPLETKQGNGGCVKVADWYHPHRNLLNEEQQRTLSQLGRPPHSTGSNSSCSGWEVKPSR